MLFRLSAIVLLCLAAGCSPAPVETPPAPAETKPALVETKTAKNEFVWEKMTRQEAKRELMRIAMDPKGYERFEFEREGQPVIFHHAFWRYGDWYAFTAQFKGNATMDRMVVTAMSGFETQSPIKVDARTLVERAVWCASQIKNGEGQATAEPIIHGPFAITVKINLQPASFDGDPIVNVDCRLLAESKSE